VDHSSRANRGRKTQLRAAISMTGRPAESSRKNAQTLSDHAAHLEGM
jgi:hypothetical protein